MSDSVGNQPSLAVTSWAVLGMLSFGEELTGNDLKKWADWSIGFFYWSPSVSQIYAELKKLDDLGLVRSRRIAGQRERGKRVYGITDSGVDALRAWSRDWSQDALVEAPMLKHGVMLRLWVGHLQDPERLKQLIVAHIANLRERALAAGLHAEHSEDEPSWAFSQMSLEWSQRYFEAEITLAEKLLADIDSVAQKYADNARLDDRHLPIPKHPGGWRTVGER